MDLCTRARAGPDFSLRPKGALFSFPRGSASQPPILFSREKRTGRWSGPRENAPGGQSRHFCGNAVRHRTAGRARFDGGTMFPRNPFFLDGRFGLGEGASHALGGVPGHLSASGRQKSFRAPAIFLWYRQAAPSLSKKEMVGPTVPASAACEKLPSPPAAEVLVPARGTPPSPRYARNLPPGAESLPLHGETPLSGGFEKTIPPSAFGCQLPLHKGAF